MIESEFYKQLSIELECTSPLEADTLLSDVPGFDSLGALTICVMVDKQFSKIISLDDVNNCKTAYDVYYLMGK